MSIFSAISQGMQDQREFRRGQRQQMAEAFADYKAANPLATAADFQSFIDSYSGGNNYIAGGAPAENVRKRIAADNQRREQERLKDKAWQEMMREEQFMQTLQPKINQYLLTLDPSKKTGPGGSIGFDWTKAVQDFEEQNSQYAPWELNFNSLITEQARSEAVTASIAKNLKLGTEFLNMVKAGGGNPANADINQFMKNYGLPKSVAEPIFASAQTEYNNEQVKLRTAFDEKVFNSAVALAKDNNIKAEDLYSSLQQIHKSDPLWADMEKDAEWFKSIKERAQSIYDDNEKAELQVLKNEAMNLAETYSTTITSNPKQILAMLKERYKDNKHGPKLFEDETWVDPYIDRATDRLDDVLNTEWETWKNLAQVTALNLSVNPNVDSSTIEEKIKASLPEKFKDRWEDFKPTVDGFVSDAEEREEDEATALIAKEQSDLRTKLDDESRKTLLIGNISSVGYDAAMENVLSKLKGELTGDYWKTVAGEKALKEILDNHMNAVIEEYSSVQDRNNYEIKKSQTQANVALINAEIEANKKNASDLFGGATAKPLAGGESRMALITPQLAGNWYFDGRTQNLLVQFAQSMAKSNEFENMSATQIKEAAELFLIENGATRWSAYQGKLQSLNALTPMERTTFGDYSSKLSTSIGSKHEDFDDGVRTILEEVEGADTREAYESAIRKLNSLKTQHKDWTVDIANQVRSHYDSRTKWVDIQGVPYSVEAIDKIMAGVEKDMTDIDAKIDDLTTKANEIEEISNETLGPDRLSELETLFNVNPDATPVENWFSKQDIINDWVNEWKQFREKKAQGADVPWIGNALNKGWNNLTKSERENEVRDFLDTFTDQEGVRIYLSNKPEVWDRFKENPIQEIRENPELKGFVKKLGIELPTE